MLPLKDRVVIRQWKPQERKIGSVIVDQSPDKPNFGIVVYVGPEVKILKPNMVVILGTKWFTNFKIGKEEFLIVNEPDIIGIADEDDLQKLGKEFNQGNPIALGSHMIN